MRIMSWALALGVLAVGFAATLSVADDAKYKVYGKGEAVAHDGKKYVDIY